MKVLRRFFKEQHGQTMVEYPLIVALISLAAIAALIAAGVSVDGIFTTVANTLAAAP